MTRTVSGALYAAVIIGSILTGPVAFGLVVLVIMVFAVTEFHQVIKLNKQVPSLALLMSAAVLIYLAGYLFTLGMIPVRVAGLGIAVYFLAILVQFLRNSDRVIGKTGVITLGLSYLALPLLLLNFLFYRDFTFEDPHIQMLIGLFLITWINDTFAYITGSLLGRHKLAERISPNKTVEGSAGGFVFSLAGAYVLSMVFDQMEPLNWIILAVIIVVFGTFGDLVESVLKRNAGIKESGNLIPGHGGILDRIDSILVATPFVFIYVYFILN